MCIDSLLRSLRPVVFAAVGVVAVAASAAAQGSITGIVTDASGGVLPGVTVEATSPALIEQVRTVVTGAMGRYRIVDLRPGTYQLTFSLPGFRTVARSDIELSGSFTATVEAVMEVGSLEETITVSGAAPTVDVQGVTQQQVISGELIGDLPTGRSEVSLAILTPGLQSLVSSRGPANPMDVGGVGALANTYMTIHGSNYLDQRVSVDGVQIRNILGPGNANNFAADMSSTEELTIDIAAGSVEQFTGGVRVNYVPKEGGNQFTGSFFATSAGSSFQADNITQDLRDRGLDDPNALSKQYDVNPSVGGPIVRNRLWFYTGARWQANENYLAGIYENVNAGDPNAWLYEPDFSRQALFTTTDNSVNARVTWQVDQRNKVSGYYHVGDRFWQDGRPNFSPDAFSHTEFPEKHLMIGRWTSPLTNELLVEVRASSFADTMSNERLPEMIRVVEQGGQFPGITYRSSGFGRTEQPNIYEVQGTASYVTGSHVLKVGVSQAGGTITQVSASSLPVSEYRFRDGVPNRLTQQATPNSRVSTLREFGVFVEDQWTVDRVTLHGGLRFDRATTFFPEQSVGPMPLAPDLQLAFPRTDWYNLKDLSPRIGATYDLFGTGRTAVKASLARYLSGQSAASGNPVGRLSRSTTRSWGDADGDFVPDCDLIDPFSNGECGAMANSNFGQPVATTTEAPELISGWGKRLANWELSASVQHELAPRVGLNVGYYRRWFKNFTITDNLATGAADYSEFSVTAPVDPRLPEGGGYVISGLYDLNPDKVGQVDNYTTFARDYGDQVHNWHGVDATINMRLDNGLMLQGGMSTGRTLTDNCGIHAQLPEVQGDGYEAHSLDRRAVSSGLDSNPFCRVETPFLTQFKALGTYTVPRLDVLLAATVISFPGPERLANYVVPSSQVEASLGRPLSGGAANVTVPLFRPGQEYGERAAMIDLRVGKILRFAGLRTVLNLDIYNALNSNEVTAETHNYGTSGSTWLRPIAIVGGRLFKFSVQADF